MDVAAWCGRCGQQFRLLEVLAAPHAGHCPRCGEPFAASYTAVVAAAVRQLDVAVGALAAAGQQLVDVAPRLHVDTAQLAADLHEVLDH